MVVGFTTTYMQSVPITTDVAISESRSWRGVQHYVIVCQRLATGRWFSPPRKLTATYNRNIVESGIKHHQTVEKQGSREIDHVQLHVFSSVL